MAQATIRFGVEELKEIVQLAGRELEREDRYITGCFLRNSLYANHGHDPIPGIRYLMNERYYQRLIARALLLATESILRPSVTAILSTSHFILGPQPMLWP
jgi:hypothetical protein